MGPARVDTLVNGRVDLKRGCDYEGRPSCPASRSTWWTPAGQNAVSRYPGLQLRRLPAQSQRDDLHGATGTLYQGTYDLDFVKSGGRLGPSRAAQSRLGLLQTTRSARERSR